MNKQRIEIYKYLNNVLNLLHIINIIKLKYVATFIIFIFIFCFFTTSCVERSMAMNQI